MNPDPSYCSWRSCLQECRSYRGIVLDFDHPLVCTALSECIGARSEPTTQRRSDCDKPSGLPSLSNLRFSSTNRHLIKVHCILIAYSVEAGRAVLCQPALLLSLCTFLTHASQFRLVASIINRGSAWDVNLTLVLVGLVSSGGLILHWRWTTLLT